MLCIGTLELKIEKQNAHSDGISSVAFSPDGKSILSGSDDKTLKVWDVANPRPYNEAEWEQFDKITYEAEDSDEEDEVEQWWRNKVTGDEQSGKPSGVGTP